MAIVVQNNFVIENIEDEKGNKIGEIKFNPNDSRIINKLTKIINDLSGALDKLKSMGDIPAIPKKKLETIEDFENVASIFKTMGKGAEIEENAVKGVIDDLSEIFGKDTIDLFLCGTHDINSLMPLLNYVLPYVKEARMERTNQYIRTTSDVME